MSFDNELFKIELRQRLKTVLSLKGLTMAGVSRESGASPNSLKDFINGHVQSPKLETFLAWTHVLGVSYATFIDGIGYSLDDHPDFEGMETSLESLAPDERASRLRSARNLKFLREVMGKSRKDFAAAATAESEGPASADLISDYEKGLKPIPQMVALRLSKAFGFGLDDLYE